MTSKKSDIKVSILCSTYNHKDYICQALDSMLMQKTNFAFEILINDDASTDGTTQIIKEYAQKHPGIVKPVFHEKNQYQKGVRGMMVRFLLPLAKGEYLALCEGDDYWTDSNKLQKQVDFLEKNKDYALCFHPVKVIFEKKEKSSYVFPDESEIKDLSVKALLEKNFIQTNSVLYRRQNYKEIAQGIMPGDWYLHLYHAQFGKIGYIDDVMSVYRRHSGGIWWDAHNNMDDIWEKHGVARLTLYHEFLKLYGDNDTYKKIIVEKISQMFKKIIEIEQNKKEKKQLEEALKKFPNLYETFYQLLKKSEQEKQEAILEKNKEIKRLHQIISTKDAQLVEIKSSRVWKTRNKVAKAVGKRTV